MTQQGEDINSATEGRVEVAEVRRKRHVFGRRCRKSTDLQFWRVDSYDNVQTLFSLFVNPVKVVDSFISLSTFLLEFFLRLTLQLPSRKSGSERVITSRGMTQQGEDINSATEGRELQSVRSLGVRLRLQR
ncbi:hypothetical protein F2Q69_00033863 [Brassica cretica]|uniref:Uncharacterized protein n=1 Tax=Brassica cretica TaxID=69181 RepID=A0A8S9SQ23_BRACR|nr:hypothetical protein F2Q69_00033863 [Brassica cretica]